MAVQFFKFGLHLSEYCFQSWPRDVAYNNFELKIEFKSVQYLLKNDPSSFKEFVMFLCCLKVQLLQKTTSTIYRLSF